MGVRGGRTRVWHRDCPCWGGWWGGLVLRARVWNCDGEGPEAWQGSWWRGWLVVGFISRELLVGVVDLLEQRLEPEADVRAREPDRAAGGLERFSRQVLRILKQNMFYILSFRK